MKNDKKKFLKKLFVTAFLLTLIVVCLQIYFLFTQYSNINRLTQISLDESLSTSINKYQLTILNADSLDDFNFSFSFRDNESSKDKSLVNEIDTELAKIESNKQSFNFSWSPEEKSNIDEMLKRFFLLTNLNQEFSSSDLWLLDSIYSEILLMKKINVEHSIQIIDIKTNQITEQTSTAFGTNNSNKYSSTTLYPITHDKSVQVVFGNPNKVVLSQMTGSILSCGMMLLLTTLCLFYYLYIISRQKKIESVREGFVNFMTHELRTPLQSIISLTKMLESEKVQNEKSIYYDVITRINNNHLKLKEQIDTLLVLSVSEKQETKLLKEKYDLNELLDNIISEYKIISEKPVQFKFESDHINIIYPVNQFHFSNALKNIIENAIKYSKEKVDIIIKIWIENNDVFIQISDNGIGIPNKDLPYIFDQYYRVSKTNSNGFGLGLNYVKWVIEAHDGEIRVQSNINIGSSFIIRLPIKTD